MHHQPTTGTLTTEELALTLGTDENPKMGSGYLLHTAAQAALALGLCGALNFIAG